MELYSDIYYVEKILAGDIACFACLLDKYSRQVYSLIQKVVYSKEDAEELTQDVLKELFKLLPQERISEDFHLRMMQQIEKESSRIKKRNEWLGLIATIMTSLLLIVLMVVIIHYFYQPQSISLPMLTFTPFPIYIGILSLILLGADSLFRKKHKEKHKE